MGAPTKRDQKFDCPKCKDYTMHTFIRDLTGSGPGYYQSTMGPAEGCQEWQCLTCKRKHEIHWSDGR